MPRDDKECLMVSSAVQLDGTAEKLRLTALIGVLGVVYGDIGTSPLYALQTCLSYFDGRHLVPEDVLGVLSLITWALIITAYAACL